MPPVTWRFTFAFDPRRRAIVLCGGDKSGGNEKRFHRRLIRADDRLDAPLAAARKQAKGKGSNNDQPGTDSEGTEPGPPQEG